MSTLKKIHENHNNRNIAFLLLEVIKEFGFEDYIEYFVINNTDLNDKALDVLNELIQAEADTEFDVKEKDAMSHLYY